MAASRPRGFPAAAADSSDEEHRRSPSGLGTITLLEFEADGLLASSESCGLSLLLVFISCRRRLGRRPVVGKSRRSVPRTCKLLCCLFCKLESDLFGCSKSGPLVDSVAENEAEFSGVCAVVSVLGCAVVSVLGCAVGSVLGSVEFIRADKLIQPIMMSSQSLS